MKTFFAGPVAALALAGLAHLTLLAGAAPAAEAGDDDEISADGIWSWKFTMPDGGEVSPRVTLKRQGENLTGKVSFRAGTEVPISNGRIQGDQIEFSVVRERDGHKVVTRYSGRILGGSVQGKVESNWAGEVQSYEWLASKPLIAPDSAWRFAVVRPTGETNRGLLRLKQDGDKLTGRISFGGRRQLDIRNGKVKGDEISFEVERRRENSTSYYTGQVVGRTITGKVKNKVGEKEHESIWQARRPKPTIEGHYEWMHGGQKRQLELKRDGGKLTGKFTMDEKQIFDLRNGKVEGDEISFEIEREREGIKTLTKFKGALADERIVGKIEFILEGNSSHQDWEAHKVDPAATDPAEGVQPDDSNNGKSESEKESEAEKETDAEKNTTE